MRGSVAGHGVEAQGRRGKCCFANLSACHESGWIARIADCHDVLIGSEHEQIAPRVHYTSHDAGYAQDGNRLIHGKSLCDTAEVDSVARHEQAGAVSWQ